MVADERAKGEISTELLDLPVTQCDAERSGETRGVGGGLGRAQGDGGTAEGAEEREAGGGESVRGGSGEGPGGVPRLRGMRGAGVGRAVLLRGGGGAMRERGGVNGGVKRLRQRRWPGEEREQR